MGGFHERRGEESDRGIACKVFLTFTHLVQAMA